MNEYGKRLNALIEWMLAEYEKHCRLRMACTAAERARIYPWLVHDNAEEYLKENFVPVRIADFILKRIRSR
jgi:hypothetical protein